MNPRLIFILRIVGGALLAILVCVGIGGFRVATFGFSSETLLMQILAGVALVVPLCLLIFAGFAWRHRFLAGILFTFGGIIFGETHAAIQESVVLARFGRHPDSMVVVHRWYPYGSFTISYQSPIGWMGDD